MTTSPTFQQELAALFRRDLGRLRKEIESFAGHDAALWESRPGITNPAGNLALHLEGNLREYIGRQLGGIAYTRTRPLEFSTRGLTAAGLSSRLAALADAIPTVIESLAGGALAATYPENVLGEPMSTRRFLVHLQGHLNYHLGQINYLRRILVG
jgi:hypothetical protein